MKKLILLLVILIAFVGVAMSIDSPTSFEMYDKTTTTISLRWVNEYSGTPDSIVVLQVNSTDSTTVGYADEVTDQTLIISAQAPGTSYTWLLRVDESGETSAYSNADTLTTIFPQSESMPSEMMINLITNPIYQAGSYNPTSTFIDTLIVNGDGGLDSTQTFFLYPYNSILSNHISEGDSVDLTCYIMSGYAPEAGGWIVTVVDSFDVTSAGADLNSITSGAPVSWHTYLRWVGKGDNGKNTTIRGLRNIRFKP